MKPVEILRKAANLIAAHGWQEIGYGCPDDGFSAVGAIYQTQGLLSEDGNLRHFDAFAAHGDAERAVIALGEYLERHHDEYTNFHGNFRDVVDCWNNTPERQAQEVIDRMRAAATELEATLRRRRMRQESGYVESATTKGGKQ